MCLGCVEVSGLLLPYGGRVFLLQAACHHPALRRHHAARSGGQLRGGSLLSVRRHHWQGIHRPRRRGKGRVLHLHEQPVELRPHQGMAMPRQPRLLTAKEM
jgi:hypothetical protein